MISGKQVDIDLSHLHMQELYNFQKEHSKANMEIGLCYTDIWSWNLIFGTHVDIDYNDLHPLELAVT